MKKIFLPLLFALKGFCAYSQGTIIQYLSGTDKDHTVPWDFFCTGGRNSGKWTTIPVPSNWELQGFGTYNYGHDKVKANEQGLYKRSFFAAGWKGSRVFIVFEGSMTDTKVMVNGKIAGPVHQGSFYRFKYDITGLVQFNARNLLEVTVDKTSENASVNDAERRNSDFWVFGGIFRPVYLEVVPDDHIDRVAIDARADGNFQMDVYAMGLQSGDTIAAQVQRTDGTNVGKPFFALGDGGFTHSVAAVAPGNASGDLKQTDPHDHAVLKSNFRSPALWSAEFPNLYQVVVTIRNGRGIVHRVKQKFGFRTVELRSGDGLYVNGARVLLKGSCRHSFWPETGRTLSYGVQVMDVGLMKQMNMNAVRMSHYPPDREFLDVCDSLGLYVLDELTGWQAKYDTVVGHKLVKELVLRDVNHPSIIFWDNGNEGGFNRGLDGDYALYDPQRRTVLHPWEKFNGTDTKHYPDYNYMVRSAASAEPNIFFPTEFMHGLYDGGAGAGLEDFWDVMIRHPHGGGGFIWAFLDEAVVRTDKDGIFDSDGNHAPDGIVGPHREKEASFYTIKEIWSPVYIDLQPIDSSFQGVISVKNRYAFTNLRQCTFKWKLVNFPSPGDKGTAPLVQAMGVSVAPDCKAGDSGVLKVPLPLTWRKNDALYLSAYGPDQKEIFTWSWPIKAPDQFIASSIAGLAVRPVGGAKLSGRGAGAKLSDRRAGAMPVVKETDQSIDVVCDGIEYYFDKTTGTIQRVVKPSGTVSLSGGPVLAGVKAGLKQFNFKAIDGKYVVEADYDGAGGAAGQGDGSLHVKWTFSPGQAVKLEYKYVQKGDADFMGITFNYPEEKITGMKWLGRGPYRVWKNRLKGQPFGVWHKAYNNAITGETFAYPEFKGYHAEVNWVVIENKEAPFTIYTADKNLYLQMLHPAREKDALANNNVEPAMPAGSIGFLNAISPIGTKFQAAKVMGPRSQTNYGSGEPIEGTLWFDFGR